MDASANIRGGAAKHEDLTSYLLREKLGEFSQTVKEVATHSFSGFDLHGQQSISESIDEVNLMA